MVVLLTSIFALLVISHSAEAATVYIDPTCAINGDGSVGCPCAAASGGAGPRNTWKGVTWTAGNTYAGQGGTSELLANYVIGGSGTDGNPITITSYGVGKFRFKSSASYAFATVGRSYITIDGVELESSATHCLYFSTFGSNITVRNSKFLRCGTTTQAAMSFSAGTISDWDSIIIEANDCSDIAGRCVSFEDIPVGNPNQYSNITIRANNMTNAASVGNTAAVHFGIQGGSLASIADLSITDNVLDRVNDEESAPSHAIEVIRVPAGSVHEERFLNVTIDRNTLTNGGGGIHVSHLGGTQNSIRWNVLRNLKATAGIISFYSWKTAIEDNAVESISTYEAAAYWDGTGIDVDLGNAWFTVRRNLVLNCRGHPFRDENGFGITNFGSRDSVFEDNILIGNKHAFYLGDESAGDPGIQLVSSNVMLNSLSDAVLTYTGMNKAHVLNQNIIRGSQGYGVRNRSTTGLRLDNNVMQNNLNGDVK